MVTPDSFTDRECGQYDVVTRSSSRSVTCHWCGQLGGTVVMSVLVSLVLLTLTDMTSVHADSDVTHPWARIDHGYTSSPGDSDVIANYRDREHRIGEWFIYSPFYFVG